MTTLDIINIIAENNKDIDAFLFYYLPSKNLIQEQLERWSTCEKNHFDLAIKVRNELHLPFWDSIMVKIFDNPSYSKVILEVQAPVASL